MPDTLQARLEVGLALHKTLEEVDELDFEEFWCWAIFLRDRQNQQMKFQAACAGAQID